MSNLTNYNVGANDLSNIFQLLGWIQQTGSGKRKWTSMVSSSNGSFLAAGALTSDLIFYTSNDYGVSWTAKFNFGQNKIMISLTSSSTGQYLATCAGDLFNGYIFTSTNFGQNWTQRYIQANWSSIASSSSGAILIACTGSGGRVYTSTNYGQNWIQTNAPSGNWRSVASDGSGTKLVAGSNYIYTSTNTGGIWIQRKYSASGWVSIASSSDGTKLTACESSGYIYTSVDSGANWIQRFGSKNWSSIASSSNGEILIASSYNSGSGLGSGYVYISTNSGQSWLEQTSLGQGEWDMVTSSSDGNKLATASSAGNANTGEGTNYIYTFNRTTSITTGYQVKGQDLNQIFSSYIEGQPKANPTGYQVNGQDLNQFFAKK